MEDTKKIEVGSQTKVQTTDLLAKVQATENKVRVDLPDLHVNHEEAKHTKVDKETSVQTPAGVVPLLATDKIGIGSRSRGGSVNISQDLGLTREMLDQVLIYVDDLLVRIDHQNNDAKLFDNSLTAEGFQGLMQAYKVKLVTDDKSQAENLTLAIREFYKAGELIQVDYMSVHEAELNMKKNQYSIIVISDEVLERIADQSVRQSILMSGRCLLMMSRFTKNNWMKDINLNLTKCGRSAAALSNKIKFFKIEGRIKVGVFMPNSNYNDKLASILLDSDKIEYISYPFFDVPSIKFDFLINMAAKYKSISDLTHDELCTTAFNNYRLYEDANPLTEYIDKFKNGESCLKRLDFLKELEIQCHIENQKLGKEQFLIPWTRKGTVLDVLNSDRSDPDVQKSIKEIPFPLLIKSDYALGNNTTHSFLVVKELPADWSQIQQNIDQEYKGLEYIVQEYILDERNIVIKARSFFDNFAVEFMVGINDITESSSGVCTDFFLQPSISKDLSEVPCDAKSKDLMNNIQNFKTNLLQRLGLHLAGIDYLLDSKNDKIIPIDLNNMPRIEKIKNVKTLLEQRFTCKQHKSI